jgi:hypothetical protein
MGMQDCGEPCRTTKVFIIFGKSFEGLLDTGKHQGIDDLLVFPGQFPELGRQGKGDQEIPGWQPLVQLVVDPLIVFMVLAVGTTAMTAGMRDIGLLPTGTLGKHMGAMRLPALFHNRKSFPVAWQNRVGVALEERILELTDNLGEQYHLTPPHVRGKSLISVLMAWRRLLPVVLVRWV